MKIDAAIFDLDGTLLDSMFVWEHLCERYLLSLDKTPDPDLNSTISTMTILQACDYLNHKYNLNTTAEEIAAMLQNTIKDFYFYEAQLKPGVKEFLSQLASMGVKMCIATASDRPYVEAALKRCEIFEYFDKIFTCSEVGLSKQSPDIFNLATAFLDADVSKTAVFEDAYFAAQTAKNSGYFVCGIFESSEPNTAKLKEISDIYIKDFSEAGAYFE